MRITDVLLFEISGAAGGPEFPPGDRQAHPMDLYRSGEETRHRSGGEEHLAERYVEILTDGGTAGLFGPIDADQCHVIRTHLRSLLIGKDPLATESLYDQMLRIHRHGRTGLFMTGVSAVDCALWDLKGKAWGVPVYRILGGPTRMKVPAYASMLGFSIRPDALRNGMGK